MVLLWVVPAVAAAVGAGLLASRVRALEEASGELLVAVRRTGELRGPLAAVRGEMQRSAPLVERLWAHWADGGPDDQAPVQS